VKWSVGFAYPYRVYLYRVHIPVCFNKMAYTVISLSAAVSIMNIV